MIRGLYTAGLGMMVQMKRMDMVSNNISNVGTTGYKKDQTVTQSFSEELMKRLDDPKFDMLDKNQSVGRMSLGVFVDSVYTDFSNGSLTNTDNSFDLAITGDGFFAVNVTDKNGVVTEKYTRDGSLSLLNGVLMTKEGNVITGNNGAITIPEGAVTIDESGNIYSNGEYVDSIKMVNFEDKHTLRKFQDNLYDITDDSVQTPFTGRVVQGAIENSNVNPVKEMVEMITINRAYEASQRVVSTLDTTLQRAVNDIATRR